MTFVDLEFTQDQNGDYDLSIGEDGDFASVDGYDTALMMSLLCERRAIASQVFEPSLRRGWLGNENSREDGFEQGSLVWLYEQARLNSDTTNGIEVYAAQGFQWLLDDNLVQSIELGASILRDGAIELDVNYYVANAPVETRNYRLWQNTGS